MQILSKQMDVVDEVDAMDGRTMLVEVVAVEQSYVWFLQLVQSAVSNKRTNLFDSDLVDYLIVFFQYFAENIC